MPRRNRVDPWGDLHAVSARGLFTGNRGCIVDEREQVVRHHRSSTLWITCLTEFRDWRVPLARPNRWTPIFPEVEATTHWRFDQPNRVDGIDFYVGSDELGHIHLNGSIHLATSPRLCSELVAEGLGRPFEWVMAGRSPV
jgi:hypothetical protein